MAINRLYNLDDSRSEIYEQTFVLTAADNCRKFLDHIPLKDSLQVYNNDTGKIFEIVDNTSPAVGQVFFDYRADYDYVAAKGVIIFNATDAAEGYTFYVRYIPVASRVDANTINQIINVVNNLDGKVWTKEDLYNPNEQDIIDWTAINNRPVVVTQTKDGLMSATDKIKLDGIPDGITTDLPFTGLDVEDKAGIAPVKHFNPSEWGTPFTVITGAGITITAKDGTSTEVAEIALDPTTAMSLIGLKQEYIDALQGDTEHSTLGPSATNRYVLAQDARLTDDYYALHTHTHKVSDVDTLQATLTDLITNKAAASHRHTLADIDGNIKGDPGDTPVFKVGTVQTGESGSQVTFSLTHDEGSDIIYNMNFSIPKGKDGVVSWAEAKSDPEAISLLKGEQGDKGDQGYPAGVKVAGTIQGQEGTEPVVEGTDPYYYFDPTTQEGYMRTDLTFTIPKGDKGDQGIPGIVLVGGVQGTDNNATPTVTPRDIKEVEIEGQKYNSVTLDFTFPRGPAGTYDNRHLVSFTADDSRWGIIDEDENYTLTIDDSFGLPITEVYEEISSGVFNKRVATIKYDNEHIYIIADAKFAGCIWVDSDSRNA